MVPFGWIVLFAAILACLVLSLWLWMRRARQCCCAQCHARVGAAAVQFCPHCGADLGPVAGAGRPAALPSPLVTRAQFQLLGVLAVWTAFYGALYIFLGARSFPRKPAEVAARPVPYGLLDAWIWPYEGESIHAVTLEPRSGGYRRITITEERHAHFKGWRNAPVINWTGDSPPVGLSQYAIRLDLDTLQAKTTTLEITPPALAWKYVDPQNPSKSYSGAGPIDGPAIWGWMIASGVDMPSPQVKEEADALAQILARTAGSGTIGGTGVPWATGRLERITALQRDALPDGVNTYAFASMRGTARDDYGPAWSIYWLSIPFGLGIYSYGVNWIYAWHKKRNDGEQ